MILMVAGEKTTPEKNMDDFLIELTLLSLQYGIGITNAPSLFTLEKQDYERHYSVNQACEMTFE